MIPQPFASLAAVHRAFGWPRPEFGRYMAECVQERADGYHLLARIEHVVEIAAEWAQRAARRAVPDAADRGRGQRNAAGQMAEMTRRLPAAEHVRIPGTGHLVHASDSEAHRTLVSALR